ncbi:glycosyltransferase [Halomontanus rarus]|uniref:glycosyltransferase n=1 Tax=Halomontanus rarus TaxID=3034020 RepID=UPI0023E8A82E|nr:glycosyltransferase [Halovivax sp. TS33]
MKSPHLAIINSDFNINGVNRVLLNLLTELDSRGYSVDLVLTHPRGNFLADLPPQVRVFTLNSFSRLGTSMLSYCPSLVYYLRQTHPDVLLAARPHTNPLTLFSNQMAGDTSRTVVCIHSIPSHQMKQRNTVHKLWSIFTSGLYRWADEIVAVSEGVKKDAASSLHLPLDNLSVIHNPIVTPHLYHQSQQPVAHRWFVNEEPPVILGAGRLHAQKDFSTLITAFSYVAEEVDSRLVILGDGEMRSELETVIEKHNLQEVVSLPGWTNNPYAYMARSSLFALSSITEALPSVLIEALACGCPPVSTACSSGPIEILENGRYGPLVPVNNPEALANALVSTLRNPPDEALLRDRATDFSVSSITDEYEKIIF